MGRSHPSGNARRAALGLLIAIAIGFAGCDRPSTNKAAPPARARAKASKANPIAAEQVEPKVIEIVCKQMSVRASELTRSTHLQKDLKADDLDRVELTMELEDEISISIPDQDVERWQTVGDVIDYMRSHRKP